MPLSTSYVNSIIWLLGGWNVIVVSVTTTEISLPQSSTPVYVPVRPGSTVGSSTSVASYVNVIVTVPFAVACGTRLTVSPAASVKVNEVPFALSK